MTKKTQNFNFEAALEELTKLVDRMEKGGLSLEESLQLFERGVALTRECQKALKSAEQKVQVLLEKHGQLVEEPYHNDE